MKNSLFKKVLAILLTLCIAFSVTSLAVSAAADQTAPATAATPPSIWKSSAKSFGVNKIYSTGLVAAGAALTRIAQASECEEFEKIASFINVWVCGGNPTTQTLAEIQELCNQILNEVKLIEQKMDSYAGYFATEEAQNKYDVLVEDMYDTWDDDVDSVIKNHGLTSAMLDFLEYEDITPKSDNDTNQNIGYFAAAYHYTNNTPDKYNRTYTEEKVLEKREALFNDFCKLYGSMPSDADSITEKADHLFSTTVVDDIMQAAIRDLASNINKNNSYADACAQVAYQSFPNLSDQYEFVTNGINKQFMQICILEMLYQEYLAMRGEYLEYKYPDDTSRWNVYQDAVDELAACNAELLGYMENRITKPLQLDTYITLALDEYVTPEDTADITLKNTAYKSRSDSDDKNNIYNGYESDATFTTEYMNFHRIAVPTSSGVDTYYILDVDTDGEGTADTSGISSGNAKTKKMLHKFDHNALDLYYASCDSYNLKLCTYTDGVNNFICPAGPSDETSLFQTDSFAFYGSSPYAYLGEYLSYVPSDKGLYQMFSKSKIDYTADGWFTDDHIIFDTLDMKDIYVGFDTSLDLVEKIDGKVVYEEDYTKDDYDKKTYDSYYTIILKEQSETLQNTLSYSVTGVGNTDMYITDSSGNRIQSGSSVACGTDLTLWMKPANNTTALNTLTQYKYNNQEKSTTPTSTKNILTRDNFYSLPIDEATGYYKLDFTMPYSNTKLELNTMSGNGVYYENTVNSTPISFYTYDNVYLEGETVQFIYQGELDHVYLCTAEGVNSIELEYDKRLNNSSGNFAMPKSDAVILITSSSFAKDGDSLLGKVGDNYIISDYESLLCMSALVNSGNPAYTKASYILTTDLDLNGKHWTTMKLFSGTLDGQGHTISNLNVNTGAGDGDRHPLFCTIESYGLILNLIIDGAQIFSSETPVKGSGVIAKHNIGVIKNCLVINSSIQLGNWDNLGGIAGYNTGHIKNCGIVNSSITRRWGGSTSKPMGGITEFNDGNVMYCFVYNCAFTNGTADNGVLFADGRDPVNCYFYSTSSNAAKTFGTEKTQSAFSSGEVAYLLNSGVTDGTQIWYQNLSGTDKDAYPVPFSSHGTVYKLTDNVYANTESVNITLPPVIGGENTNGTLPPVNGEENTTPVSTDADSSSDGGNNADKDVVDTGMGIPFALMLSVAVSAIVLITTLRKKRSV